MTGSSSRSIYYLAAFSRFINRLIKYYHVQVDNLNQAEVHATQHTFRSYLIFWTGQLFSLLGSSIVSFTVIWWITVETQSTLFLSIAALLAFLPQLITIPIGGVVTDRSDRKQIIALADSFQALTTFCLILIFLAGNVNVWAVMLINGLRGVFQAFHIPAVNAIIPVMVPKEHLSRINGINNLLTGLINVIGPVLAASLMTFWTAGEILWIDVITFFIAIVPLLLITIPSVKKESEQQEKPSFVQEFELGIKTLNSTPGILALATWSAILNFLITPYMILMPYFINVTHSGTESDLAFIMASFQIGVIVGGLIVTFKKTWNNKVATLLALTFIINTAIGILAVAPKGVFQVMIASQLFIGMSFAIAVPLYSTILQMAVPPDKLGRIHSIDWFLSLAVTPIAMVISGPLAEMVGIVNLFLVSAVLGILSNAFIWLFTGITSINYDLTAELEKETTIVV
ncbi:MAG: MFS transporter [Candidatus Odinarchaeota archaeon]